MSSTPVEVWAFPHVTNPASNVAATGDRHWPPRLAPNDHRIRPQQFTAIRQSNIAA